MNSNNGSSINAFLVGFIVGGILGVLFAPDKGENTRKNLKRSYTKWSKKALDVVQELGEEVEPYMEEVVEAAAPVFQEIRPMGELEETNQSASPMPAGGQAAAESCPSCLEEQGQPELSGQGPSAVGQAVGRVRGEIEKRVKKKPRPQFFKGV